MKPESLNWKKTSNELPKEHLALCLLIINGKILADIFTYSKHNKTFICQSSFIDGESAKRIAFDYVIKGSDVEYWIGKDELPMPV